jgi:PAS domain S-box-containing protein
MNYLNRSKEELIADLTLLEHENNELRLSLEKSKSLQSDDFKKKYHTQIDFRESKEYLKLVFNTNPDAALITRLADGMVIDVNEGYTKISGFTREETIGLSSLDIKLWKNPEERQLVVNEILKQGFCANFEAEFVRKDGSSFFGLISAKVFSINDIQHITSTIHDITELKQAEETLRKSEIKIQKNYAVLNSIFESSQNVVIFSLDANYCYIAFTNSHKQTMKQIWGADIEIGMNMLELIGNPDDRKKAKYNFDRVLKGEHLRFEEEYGDSSLQRSHYEDIYNPIFDSKGDIIGLSVFVIDISSRKTTEEKLRINEERYRLLAENSKDVIWTMKLDGSITYISPAVEQLRGFTVEEAMNQTIDKILTPDSQVIVIDYINKISAAFASGLPLESFKGENEYYCKDGSTLWTEVIVYPIPANDLNSVTLLGVSRGISERKQAEEALKKSEEKFRLLYANMIDGSALHTLVYDKKGIPSDYLIVDINPAFEAQIGVSKETVINKTSREAYGVEAPPYLDIYSRVALTGKPEVFETYFAPLDKYFSISVYCPYKGSFATIFENITERRKAEQDLHIILTKYKVLFDIFPIGITISDDNGNIIESNKLAESLIGISREEQEKRKIGGEEWRIIRPDGKTMPVSEFASVRALEEKRTVSNVEMGIVKENNKIIWLFVSATPIPIEGYGVAIVYIDITERKQKEIENIRTQKLLEDSQRIGKIGGWELNMDTLELKWTREMYLIHEVESTFVPSIEMRSIFYTPESIPVIDEAVRKAIKEGKSYEIDSEIITAKGNRRSVRAIGKVDLENRRVFGLFQDITERKQAELALSQSEEKYRDLFEKSKIGMFRLKMDLSEILEVNEKLIQILGFSVDEMNAGPSVIRFNNKKQRDELFILLEKNKYVDDFEIEIIVKDGSIKTLLISLTVYTDNEIIVGSFIDITDRKIAEAELKIKNEQLKELNATKDKFFSIIAHDLKSPFNGILGLSGLLINEARNLDIDSILKYTEIIHSSAKQTFSLLENLLDWAKTQQGGFHFEPKKIFINNLIKTEIEGLKFYAVQKNIHIINKTNEGIVITADEKMLSVVVRNLISNAIKFTPKDGFVTIGTKPDNENLEVSISDTGVGMEQDTIEKLFKIDSSFTTRGTENEKGTGLGLLLCKEFIEKHQGKIWAESEIGKGSKFMFTVPSKY